jgi:hypothetical protein
MKNWESTKQRLLDCPLPQATATYTVIPHKVFLEEITGELKDKGYTIADERYLSLHNCNVLTGMYRIQSDIGGELSPAISFVNSYNKTRKAEIRATAVVLVCKNGMMGNIANGYYARKHSGDALTDFRDHIKTVIGGLQEEFERLVKNKEEMKAITLNPLIRSSLIGDMIVNEGLLTLSQLAILKKEMKKSIYFSGDSLWDFYNNCTEAFKENHPAIFDKQHVKFHTYICDKFKLSGSRGLYPCLPEFDLGRQIYLNLDVIPQADFDEIEPEINLE